MGKRGRVWIVVVAVALLGVVAWMVFRAPANPPEPFYKGSPLSFWLSLQINTDPPDGDKEIERDAARKAASVVAIDQIGTNAVPFLLQMLRAHDSPLKRRFLIWASGRSFLHIHYTNPAEFYELAQIGFKMLGPRAAGAVPELAKILDKNFPPESQEYAAWSLGYIGPDARSAVPSLLRAAASKDYVVRNNAIWALGKIHADSDVVIPVLVKELHDPRSLSTFVTATALGDFKGEAKSAVPAMVEWLKDQDRGSSSKIDSAARPAVERALQQIDPETYARVVTNGPDATGTK